MKKITKESIVKRTILNKDFERNIVFFIDVSGDCL